MKTVAAAALVAVTLACGKADGPIRVIREETAAGTRLALVATHAAQINAQLKPALELKDGTVFRFDAAGRSPDSAYFTTAPELILPRGIVARGKIRISVCDSGEAVCRLVTIALR
jgi:hypothetical protein